MPETISLAAVATTGGVQGFSVLNWSVGPYLPHALPGGPLGSSGNGEMDGCEVSRSRSGALSDEMGIQGDSALADRVVDLQTLDN